MQKVTKNIQKKTGRPLKQKDKAHQSTQEIWFQIQYPREIVQVLASRCQILFKPLSGQSAKDFKVEIVSKGNEQNIQDDERIKKNTYEDLKKNRQKFSNKLEEYQKNVLRKLSLSEDKNYFFIGDNNYFEDFIGLNEDLQTLKYIIDRDFTKTFRRIIDIIENEETYPVDLYKYESHKHLVSWALLIVWGKEGRRLLTKLQASSDKQSQPPDPTVLLEYIKQSKEYYAKYDQCSLEELLCYFREDYEFEINKLIGELQKVIQRK